MQIALFRTWYRGTADAIYQNMHLIEDFNPDLVAVFGGDHIYKMDISQMIDFHACNNAIATVAAIPVPISEGRQFGVIQVDKDWPSCCPESDFTQATDFLHDIGRIVSSHHVDFVMTLVRKAQSSFLRQLQQLSVLRFRCACGSVISFLSKPT